MMTPIRRQYLQIKKQHPDAILLFRLGDFYETFDEQAELVARELEITLTSREMGKGQRVPLAGIPYHAASGHIAKLVSRGHKVAICEQMSDPAESRGLVERAVVRVVTPGTVVDPGMLESKSNNYLVAVVSEGDQAGVAYVDVTTGEFGTTQVAANQVSVEVERLQPAELLTPAGLALQLVSSPALTPLEERYFRLSRAREALLEHFEVTSLEPFGCANLPLAIKAAGAVLQYVAETQRSALGQISQPRTYSVDAYMVLDVQARRNLELFQAARSGGARGSLLAILDVTRTPVGGRLLRKWLGQPLLEVRRIHTRQEVVEELLRDDILRDTVLSALARVGDLERLINRVSLGIASPADVMTLGRSLEAVAQVRRVILPESGAVAEARSPEGAPTAGHVGSLPAGRRPLARLGERIDDCAEIVELVHQVLVDEPPPSLADGGVIRPGFSAELDGLRTATSSAKDYIASLERSERSRTGVKSLKVGYNRVFGYYVEVSNANLETRWLGSSARTPLPTTDGTEDTCTCATTREHLERCLGYVRKQTLVGAERFFTPELKEYETLVLNGQERIGELESALFRQLCRQVADVAPRIRRTADAIACLDVLAAFAEVAARFGFVRPQVDDGDELYVTAGRHPVVERNLPPGEFVPNDVHISNSKEQILVLTGPNMAGKSTYLRQVALIVVMAQIGSYVPAETAKIGVVDRVFTRIGAQDDLALGQSTFMVEMLETSLALLQSTPRSLLILDEVGRGTSTFDGLAIARAVLEYLHNDRRCGAKTLFATHYHELTKLEDHLPRVRNYRMAVLEEGDHIVFLRRVVPGGADRSYGIHVARLAGIPKAVTRRAEEVLRELEEGSGADRLDGHHRNSPSAALQLSLFPQTDPLIEEMAKLDVDSLTPLEAITKLYELRQRAKRSSADAKANS